MQKSKRNIIYFGKTNYRTDNRFFGMYEDNADLYFHRLILGKTGTGKTNFLLCNILQQIEYNTSSVVVFDANGDLIRAIDERMPVERIKDLIIIDPSNPHCSFGYNPIKNVSDEHKPRVVSAIIEIFAKLYASAWGPRIEHLIRNAVFTLMACGNANIGDIKRLLISEKFRCACRKQIKDNKELSDFWEFEFVHYPQSAIFPLLSKLSGFLLNPSVQRTIIKPRIDISLRKAIDTKKIILIRLPKGELGDDVTHILGNLLLTSLALAGYSRSNQLEWERSATSVYIDEFAEFNSKALISMFSVLRKYKVALTIGSQYLSQINKEIKDSLISNVGTIISFRASIDVAKEIGKHFAPTFKPEQLLRLPNYHAVLTMMIDGIPSPPFSCRTITYSDVINFRKERLGNQGTI